SRSPGQARSASITRSSGSESASSSADSSPGANGSSSPGASLRAFRSATTHACTRLHRLRDDGRTRWRLRRRGQCQRVGVGQVVVRIAESQLCTQACPCSSDPCANGALERREVLRRELRRLYRLQNFAEG